MRIKYLRREGGSSGMLNKYPGCSVKCILCTEKKEREQMGICKPFSVSREVPGNWKKMTKARLQTRAIRSMDDPRKPAGIPHRMHAARLAHFKATCR
jgi:hypothetical protein